MRFSPLSALFAATLLAGCTELFGIDSPQLDGDGGPSTGGSSGASSGGSSGASSGGSSGGSADASGEAGSSGGSGGSSGAADAASGDAADGGSSGGSSGSSGSSSGSTSDAGCANPLTLPFFVSDWFTPSGFAGDVSHVSMSSAASACPNRSVADAGGACYAVTFTPDPAALADGGTDWGGCFWQSPADNWGSRPGLCVAPGATEVSFYVKGAVGGEVVDVTIGGINVNGGSLPYGDTHLAVGPTPFTLTTAWTKETISLAGSNYTGGVLGGFAWAVTATSSTTFYIDDIEWE